VFLYQPHPSKLLVVDVDAQIYHLPKSFEREGVVQSAIYLSIYLAIYLSIYLRF